MMGNKWVSRCFIWNYLYYWGFYFYKVVCDYELMDSG